MPLDRSPWDRRRSTERSQRDESCTAVENRSGPRRTRGDIRATLATRCAQRLRTMVSAGVDRSPHPTAVQECVRLQDPLCRKQNRKPEQPPRWLLFEDRRSMHEAALVEHRRRRNAAALQCLTQIMSRIGAAISVGLAKIRYASGRNQHCESAVGKTECANFLWIQPLMFRP